MRNIQGIAHNGDVVEPRKPDKGVVVGNRQLSANGRQALESSQVCQGAIAVELSADDILFTVATGIPLSA